MTTDNDAGLAQSSRPPVIDAAQAAGISTPPGAFASRPRFVPAPAPVPQADAAPTPEPPADVLDMLRTQPVPAVETAVQAVQAAPAPIAPAAPVSAAGDPAPANPAPAGPVWLGTKPRRVVIELDHPFLLDGVAWREIVCERMTGAELDAFYDLPSELRGTYLPTVKAPPAVQAALDADDQERVREAGLRFLPRSLGPVSPSTPDPSALSPDTSAATSASA